VTAQSHVEEPEGDLGNGTLCYVYGIVPSDIDMPEG